MSSDRQPGRDAPSTGFAGIDSTPRTPLSKTIEAKSMSIWVIFVDYAAAGPAGRWLMQSNETKPALIWVKFAGCPAAIWDR
jgi:hypothetical protein